MLPTIGACLIDASHTGNNQEVSRRRNKTPLNQKMSRRVSTPRLFVLSQCDAHYHTRRTVTGTSVANLSQSHRVSEGMQEGGMFVLLLHGGEDGRIRIFKSGYDIRKFFASLRAYPLFTILTR